MTCPRDAAYLKRVGRSPGGGYGGDTGRVYTHARQVESCREPSVEVPSTCLCVERVRSKVNDSREENTFPSVRPAIQRHHRRPTVPSSTDATGESRVAIDSGQNSAYRRLVHSLAITDSGQTADCVNAKPVRTTLGT
jgi:hypothetical protein